MNIVFISRCLIKKCNILNKKNKYLSRREKSQSLNCLGKAKLNKQTIQFTKVEEKKCKEKEEVMIIQTQHQEEGETGQEGEGAIAQE